MEEEDIIDAIKCMMEIDAKRDKQLYIILTNKQFEIFSREFGDNCGFSSNIKVKKAPIL